MKRTAALTVALLLAASLTACGETKPPAARSAVSEPVQSTPTRPAESILYFDKLPEGVSPDTAFGWCDFDRDGTEEEYKFTYRQDEMADWHYTVSIGGASVDGYAASLFDQPYLVSLDGETVQLAVYDEGPSSDPLFTVYGWNGKTIFEAGMIAAAPEEITLADGEIVAPIRFDVMQTSWFPQRFQLAGERIVRLEEPERWYEYAGGVGELTTAAELTLFRSDTLENAASITVPANTAVTVTGVALDRAVENPSAGDDPLYWVRVRADASGEVGYLLANAYQCRLPGVGVVEPASLFEGLIFAD